MNWNTYILQDQKIPVSLPINLWSDNKAALHITTNQVSHEHTKQLDIDCHLVRGYYNEGFIQPLHISTKQQVVDSFTKDLVASSFSLFFFIKLGLQNPYQAPS